MWSWIGVVVLLAAIWRLAHVYQRSIKRRHAEIEALFSDVVPLLDECEFEQVGPQQFPKLKGRYRDFSVQLQPVVDTLATRRLPALWLLVTLQDKLPTTARFDMMMRPAAATTFSNFDHLPYTLAHPTGFPEYAVVRTDDAQSVIPSHIIKPHLGLFFGPRAKELLITENGLRIVWLLAEADRARYGVFRQAEFGDVKIDSTKVQELLATLIALRSDILKWEKQK